MLTDFGRAYPRRGWGELGNKGETRVVGDSQVRKETNRGWFVSSVLPFPPPPDEHTAPAALYAPAPGQRHVPDDKDDMFGHTAHHSPPAHCDAQHLACKREPEGPLWRPDKTNLTDCSSFSKQLSHLVTVQQKNAVT